MTIPSMPTGVEHCWSAEDVRSEIRVTIPSMPTGVEHLNQCKDVIAGYGDDPFDADRR